MKHTRCLKLVAASALASLFVLPACGDSPSSGSSRGGGNDSDAGGAFVGTGGASFIPPATGGATATGGSSGTSTGGTGGAGPGADAGGAGGAGGAAAADAGLCATANEPVIDPTLFPVCDQCAAARCVPATAVPEAVREQLADCPDPTSKCVPDTFVATGGNLLLTTCESLDGAEGRCVPSCLPAVQSMATYLPTVGCAVNEVCAPCFNPLDGVDTGACGVACDPGPTEPAVTFEKCCGGIGSCVPEALVPAELAPSLGPDTCADAARLCAPDQFVDTANQPLACTSLLGAEGRCIPDCVPAVASRAAFLPVDVCATGELCAPCFDPTTGLPTGSCSINGDAPDPTSPIVTFAECCGALGVCVPTSLVPVAQQSLLDANTCTGQGELCAPRDLTDSTFIPTSCDSIAGAEGRCLPACLPDIAAQADRLPQAICDVGYLCAPCYDPLTGVATGACDLNGDAPVEPPYVFGTCCGGLGSCVPSSLVPAAQQSLLDADTCQGTDVLCAPDKLADTTYIPPTCTSIGGFEGRCLAACLPDIEAQASRLPQDLCDVGELCAPCYDPMTGLTTGACEQNGDQPVDPPGVFDPCCGGLGTCVPPNAVPAAQQALLDANTCTDPGYLCAPTALADTSFKPPACDSISGFEGRCLPACLPDIAAQADRLPQATCATGELCAPCYDPITGAATGACAINGDAPVEPAQTFPTCCSGDGVCVPTTLVPAAQQSLLGTDTCTGGGTLCAPTNLTDPTFKPAVCYSFEPQHREGRCIEACVPAVQERASQLLQENCAAGQLCAPCYDPVVGGSTGACEINGDAPLEPDPGTFVTCEATNTLASFLCIGAPIVPPVEGRCVPSYIVPASQAGLLCMVTCMNGELCAPCINPLDGVATGACP